MRLAGVNTLDRNAPLFENVKMPAPPNPNEVSFETNHFYDLAGTSDVVRLKNQPSTFREVRWIGNRFLGRWRNNVPGGMNGSGNSFGRPPSGDPQAIATGLFETWARATGFDKYRYRAPAQGTAPGNP